MHMDISAVVMSVRVGADKGLVSGKMLFAKLLAQLLRPVYGQAVVLCVTGVKADDIVVALYVLPFPSSVGFMVNSSCSKVRYCSAAP